MSFYECVFVARQDISSTQVDALSAHLTQIIKNQKGDVKKIEYCGLKPLAYKIKKNRKGHYVLLNIEAPPTAIAEMERNMRLNEDVLRFLTVKVEKLDSRPSPLSQTRSQKEGRRFEEEDYESERPSSFDEASA